MEINTNKLIIFKAVCNIINIRMTDFVPANGSNMILITQTISHSAVSEKRRNNLVNEMRPYDIPMVFVHGQLKTDVATIKYMLTANTRKCLETFKKTTYQYGFLCDDDFHPHPDFLVELNKTLELLPKNWRCLHLCPGYLWGRMYRRCKVAGKLDPEYNIDGLECHESGRFFINCHKYPLLHGWLGGPIAVVVNRDHIDTFIEEFNWECFYDVQSNDVMLKRMMKDQDFICRSPLLGYENEQGGTTLW